MKKKIIRRLPDRHFEGELHPVLQRIYSARGIYSLAELEKGLDQLLSFHLLSNIEQAVAHLSEALTSQQHIMIIGDFDADGATSTALAVQALKMMGAKNVSYCVPNRFEYGYGLTPEIVRLAHQSKPQLIITVDNGISSHEGVMEAKLLGIKVVITDHHLPGQALPQAEAIVNPNLPDDLFPSKNLAGVGVIFYVMMALRANLREKGWFTTQGLSIPNMANLLDLVALGTVADVVPLDSNNRILVHQGLLRIKNGKVRPGIKSLLDVAGKNMVRLTSADLGYAIAPRLNAAGRLIDMRLGIECLLAESEKEALPLAMQLDDLNKERQQIEEGMQAQANVSLLNLRLNETLPMGLCLFDEQWHQGIIGILASRVKEKVNRPVFAFALATATELKGSGRSIAGLHLKDVLETMAASDPELISKFGGHAMAAGLSLPREHLERFSVLFEQVVSDVLNENDLESVIHSDGELCSRTLTLDMAQTLKSEGPWGQGFPEPVFDGQFKVINHRILKEKHIKFVLSGYGGLVFDAIAFNIDPTQYAIAEDCAINVAYRLDINEYRGKTTMQLLIDYFDVVSS